MKKILIILLTIFAFILPVWVYSAWCNIKTDTFDKNSLTISWVLDSCLEDSKLVNWENADIEAWLKKLISNWVENISIILWTLAVWSIVYGSLLMTLSIWEDDKIKKAKDIIKWWIIGFLWLIFASSIILLVVNIMYSLEI